MPRRFEPSPLAPRRTPDNVARDYDLGFGSVVSRETGSDFSIATGRSTSCDRDSDGSTAFRPPTSCLTVSRIDEIVWNARFRSMFLSSDARSRVAVDVSPFTTSRRRNFSSTQAVSIVETRGSD